MALIACTDAGTTSRRVTKASIVPGERHGALVAVRATRKISRSTSWVWAWRCDCGNEVERLGPEVRRARKASCGCLNGRAPINLLGRRFGRWLVIAASDIRVAKRTVWSCRCDCGATALVMTNHLLRGKSVSCGCLKSELTSARLTTHGESDCSPEYRAWCQLQSRCYNHSSRNYDDYGGRGIKVCQRWRDGFPNFLADMGRRPSRAYSIDRIDVNGDYEPANCRWATAQTQANNTRRNHYVIVRGERLTVAQAVRRYGGVYGTVKWRMYQGQTIEQALRLS